MNAALFSSATPEWGTPQDLFNALNRRFSFTLDVCASPENAKCPHFFSKEEDGLSRPWSGRCWMNPPYGRFIGAWVEKARREAENGVLVVGLLPARTDTRLWQQNVLRHADVRNVSDRLRFVKYRGERERERER